MNEPEVLSCLLRARGGFDVTAEFLPHGGEYFFRESVLLSRAKADEQCGGENIHRDCLFDGRIPDRISNPSADRNPTPAFIDHRLDRK